MSISLRGDIKDFGIPEIFQLVGQQRKTGVLELGRGGEAVRIALYQGAVVRAEPVGAEPESAFVEWLVRCGALPQADALRVLRDCRQSAQSVQAICQAGALVSPELLAEVRALLTRESVFSVLSWTTGHFHFQAEEVESPGEGVEPLAAEQVLMEGLRVLDESHRFAFLVPSRDLVFRATGSLALLRQRLPGDVAAERVFLRVDGRATAQRVIDLARLGSFEGTRALAELRQNGLLEVAGTRPPRMPSALASRSRAAELWSAACAIWLPIGLLGATLVLAQGLVRSAPAARAGGIHWSALERVQQGFELRRMRHAAEACRLRTGRLPATLEELGTLGCLPPGRLAGPERAAYYYAVRDGEMLLLAPSHTPR